MVPTYWLTVDLTLLLLTTKCSLTLTDLPLIPVWLRFLFSSYWKSVDISKLEVIMTDQTDLDISVLTVTLTAGKLQSTGDISAILKTNNKAFEFAVATVDEFGVKSAHVGTKFTAASSAKAAAPSKVQLNGGFKSGSRADVSWTVPTYAPSPIVKYNVYFMQSKDASLQTATSTIGGKSFTAGQLLATQAKAKSLDNLLPPLLTKLLLLALITLPTLHSSLLPLPRTLTEMTLKVISPLTLLLMCVT